MQQNRDADCCGLKIRFTIGKSIIIAVKRQIIDLAARRVGFAIPKRNYLICRKEPLIVDVVGNVRQLIPKPARQEKPRRNRLGK